MKGFYKQLCEILGQHGWNFYKPGKGSHQKWMKGGTIILVPFNCDSRHTANAVLRAAGIDHRF